MKLTTVDGVPLFDVLSKKGITELGDCNPKEKPRRGTFEKHISDVQQDFWGRRFKVYDGWKKQWFADYQRNGFIRMKTGFVVSGSYKKNQIINSPVQGAAFHCLLWSLIRLQKQLNKRKMRSLVVGQIHDSVLMDCTPEELDEVIGLAVEIMTKQLREQWKWIVIPLEVEVEASDTNWFLKKEYKL
jgi:hypothetical protein